MTTSCPACAAPLGAADPRCPRCGLLLVGPVAGELGRLDADLAVLGERRRWLLAQLWRESAGAPPVGTSPEPLPLPRDRPAGWSTQRLLLGLGVLLVVVAGLVFVAVSWRTLGVVGQVAVVVGAALATCVASRVVERRRLTASAEAAAVLGAGLLGVGLVAARTLGLAGLDEVDRYTYGCGAAAVLALLCVVAGLRSTARAWGVLAVLAACLAVPAGLRAADPGWFAYALAFAVGAGVLAAARRVPGRWFRVRGPAGVAAVALAVAAWCVAPLAAWTDRSPQAPASAAVGLAVAVVVLLACARGGGAGRVWAAHPVLGLAATVAAATQLAAACSLAPAGVRGGAAVLAGAALMAACWHRTDPWRTWAGTVATTTATTLALLWTDLLVDLDERSPLFVDVPGPFVRDATWVSALVVAAAGVASGLLVARRRPTWRPLASGWVAAAGLAGVAVASSSTTLTVLAVTLAAAATVLAVWAYRSTGPAEVVLLAAAVVGELVALVVASDAEGTSTPPGAVLAASGVVALAYGFRPGRSFLWWVGAGAVSAGSWLWLLDGDVGTVEAYSAPLAALCLLAGGLGRLRHRGLSSWAVAGPAVVAGLVPSAVASVHDQGLLRPFLLLGVAGTLLLLGVWRRWQALVVVPALAVAVVAVSQLAPWAVGLPRWVSLGAAGVLLLVVGVRYEARRRDVLSAAAWIRGLD